MMDPEETFQWCRYKPPQNVAASNINNNFIIPHCFYGQQIKEELGWAVLAQGLSNVAVFKK